MRLFAVRCVDGKQGVGFFWAKDLVDLWWFVDSVMDPSDCEYHPISGSAAVVWGEEGHPLGVHGGGEEDDGGEVNFEVIREGISFNELEDYVYGEVPKGWKPLPYADQPGGGVYELARKLSGQKSRR